MNLAAILAALAGANQAVTLATEIGGVVVPLGKFVVSEVEKLAASGTTTETYQLVISTGDDNLTGADKDFTDTLAAVNVEREKAGLAPLVVPSVS